jgi:hypothetical protein
MYASLNRVIWLNRLPNAKIVLLEDSALPKCHGITVHDDVFVKPIIFLNLKYKRWGKTLVHEMLHVAEPHLVHGRIFDTIVDFYWRVAKHNLKGARSL